MIEEEKAKEALALALGEAAWLSRRRGCNTHSFLMSELIRYALVYLFDGDSEAADAYAKKMSARVEAKASELQ